MGELGELGKAAEIYVDLWGAVESLQRAVETVGVSSASHQIKRKCMDMKCTDAQISARSVIHFQYQGTSFTLLAICLFLITCLPYLPHL